MIKYTEHINESIKSDNNTIYYLRHPNNYDYLMVVEDNELKGFVTLGFITESMQRYGVFTNGTIWGPKNGDILISSLITKCGPVIPSSNESDSAKNAWLRRYNDINFITRRIPSLGFYSIYEQEDFLNTIYDIPNNLKRNIIINDLKSDNILYNTLCEQVKEKHIWMTEVFMKDKEKYYTLGESNDRFEWLKETNKYEKIDNEKEFFLRNKISFKL